jgi:hypothetical protein
MGEVVLRAVIEVGCGLTGHLVLRAITLGRWDVANGRDDMAALVGLVFWVAVGIGVWLAFFR